jgi:hypothetical protein
MTTDYEELHNASIDVLLIRVIDQGNGASRHEIKRRQMLVKPMPKLSKYLLDELMKFEGVERVEPIIRDHGNDLHEIDISDTPDMICTLARKMMRDGFKGQGMRDQERASAYIKMAAANPKVMDELPDSGHAFWKSAQFHYRMWKTEQS